MLENPRGLSTEPELACARAGIEALWAGRVQGQFAGVDGVPIAYVYLERERAERAVIISPGRTEFIDKYAEVAFDFYHQGYSVFVLDHRGQGWSGRLLSDRHKGHVERFDHYVEDLQQFITEVVAPRAERAPLILGHSMGGAIAVRHLQLYPGVLAAAALCAPMLEINTGAPQSVVWPILSRIDALLAALSKEPGYIPGGGIYEELAYRSEGRANNLTSSELRLNYFNEQYRAHPEVQLGAPTRHWLLQAFECMQTILREADKIDVPVTLMIAGADRIVRSGGQRELVQALRALGRTEIDCVEFEGAEHELLMESDRYRLPALHHVLDFFERVQPLR